MGIDSVQLEGTWLTPLSRALERYLGGPWDTNELQDTRSTIIKGVRQTSRSFPLFIPCRFNPCLFTHTIAGLVDRTYSTIHAPDEFQKRQGELPVLYIAIYR